MSTSSGLAPKVGMHTVAAVEAGILKLKLALNPLLASTVALARVKFAAIGPAGVGTTMLANAKSPGAGRATHAFQPAAFGWIPINPDAMLPAGVAAHTCECVPSCLVSHVIIIARCV